MANFNFSSDAGSVDQCSGDGGDSERLYNSWLQDVHTKFLALTDTRKLRMLDSLVYICGSKELFHLAAMLPTLLCLDFLRHLPPETSTHILLYLDKKSLFGCCLVSKFWNELINSLQAVWIRMARCAGARITLEPGSPAMMYKQIYIRSKSLVRAMQDKSAFEEITLSGHSSRVTAIAHYGDLVATGSDDRTVRFWDVNTGNCVKVIATDCVASLKLDNLYLYTTSYNGTAACWDVDTGHSMCQYIGHTSGVLCLDARADVDLLVTGSADTTVKVWQLTTGCLRITLSPTDASEGDLVLKVRIVNYIASPTQNEEELGILLLVIVNRKNCYFWTVANNEITNTVVLNNSSCCLCRHIATENIFNPLNLNKIHSISNYTTEFVDNKCGYRKLSTVYLPHLSMRLVRCQAVMSVGQRFAVFLDVFGHIEVIDVHSSQIVCSIATAVGMNGLSLDRSSVTQGSYDWLDGFTEYNPSGLFFGLCLRNNNILLLKWRDIT